MSDLDPDSKKLIQKTGSDIKNDYERIIVLLGKTIEQIKEGKLSEEEAVDLLQKIHDLFVENLNLLRGQGFIKEVVEKGD